MDDPRITPAARGHHGEAVSWTLDSPQDRPADPLEGWSPRRVAGLARRADRTRLRGPGALDALGGRLGVPSRQLRLLAEAWAAGGRSGVTALGPAPEQPDQLTMLHARVAVETWALRSFPGRSARADVWRNRVTIWLRDRRGTGGDRPLAHLRLSADGRWHLYRRGALGDWWPVSLHDTGDGRDIYRSLAVVRDDRLRLFCPGPPREERHTRP
jgi:hypothetical protein